MKMQKLFATALAFASVFAIATAQAQTDRPLKIIIGVPPGGSLDALARAVQPIMAAELKRAVVIENKPGAGTRLAAELLKNAAPDGDTVMIAPIVVPVLAPLTFSKLNYDAAKDFTPVIHMTNFHFGLAVPAEAPYKSLAEFLTWMKANPSKANFGMPAAGSLPHFLGLLVAKEVNVDIVPVPFQGGAPLITALAGNQVASGIDVVGEQAELHKTGKLRILATSGSARSKVSPDVPTFRELGYANIQAQGWFAMYAPAKTPAAMVNAINAAANKALASPDVIERIAKMSLEPTGGSPADLQKITDQEFARWTPVVKASGFKAD